MRFRIEQGSVAAAMSPVLGWEMAETRVPRPEPLACSNDDQLVSLFLESRSNEVFEMLVDRHKRRIFGLALAILGPGFEAEAEEITQEVFITAFRKLSSFRRESSFGSWLYRIAQRKTIDLRNSARLRHPHAPAEALEGSLSPREGGAGPHDHAEVRQSRRLLLAAIRELPEPGPEILRLFYWQGWSVAEISEALGIASGTIKSLLFRARRVLFERLKGKGISYAAPLP